MSRPERVRTHFHKFLFVRVKAGFTCFYCVFSATVVWKTVF